MYLSYPPDYSHVHEKAIKSIRNAFISDDSEIKDKLYKWHQYSSIDKMQILYATHTHINQQITEEIFIFYNISPELEFLIYQWHKMITKSIPLILHNCKTPIMQFTDISIEFK